MARKRQRTDSTLSRDCERRRLRSHSQDMAAHVQRAAEQTVHRDRQARFRARRRNVETHALGQSQYLPFHQQKALGAFLDCVRSVAADPPECVVCMERFQGIQMHGVECIRCRREVQYCWAIFSFPAFVLTMFFAAQRTPIRRGQQRRS